MHECLQIPEILDLIFRFVPPDPVPITARRYLDSCALTCRYFSEIALDIIWDTQSSLVPLLKTLPPHCWREWRRSQVGADDDSMFDKAFEVEIPSVDEWKGLKAYASRIRKIIYRPYAFHSTQANGETYDLKALSKISSAHLGTTEPLFPNLLYLEFFRLKDAKSCLHIFLQSNSISLSLRSIDIDHNNKNAITYLFPPIRLQALHMEVLDLGSHKEDVAAWECRDLSDLVCEMRQLRGLHCGIRKLTGYGLNSLATLPNLCKVQLENTADEVLHAISLASSRKSIFSSLRHLTMNENNLVSFAGLIKRMPPLLLESLTLHLSKVPEPSDFKQTVKTIVERMEKTSPIRRLVFKYEPPILSRRRNRQDSDDPTSAGVFPAHCLEPLLSLLNLTDFTLNIPWSFSLDDADLENIARSWPRLRRFQLGTMHGWWTISHITPGGLLPLLKGCRELDYLLLPFDGTVSPPPLESISDDHINNNIEYLFVGDSKLNGASIKQLATFIGKVFPKLNGIGGSWLSTQRDETGWRGDLWGRVVSEIKSQKSQAVNL